MTLVILALFAAMAGALPSVPRPSTTSPLSAFIENRGQWKVPARFVLRSRGLDLWGADRSILLHQHRVITLDSLRLGSGGDFVPVRVRRLGAVVSLSFVGAGPATMTPIDRLPGSLRSYVGGRDRWVTDIGRYAGLRYRNLYPGIDLDLSMADGPRYSFLVAPGADPERIRWRFDGAEEVELLDNALSIATSAGRIDHRGLLAYQEFDGVRRIIPCRFVRRGGEFGLVTGPYDRSRSLVIDPVITSVMIGGSDYERPGGATVDGDGNILIVGTTQSVDLPVTEGAYDTVCGPPTEAFAMKVQPGSDELIWATYLGGGEGEGGNGVSVAADNSLVAAGLTASADFPTTPGAPSEWFGGGIDAFVTRLDPDGFILFSSYLGGDGIDAAAALLFATDTIVVAGSTTSVDFPRPLGINDSSSPTGQAFILMMEGDGASVLGGISIGGGGEDYGYSLAAGVDGSYLLGGITSSTDIPVSPGAVQQALARDDTSRFDFLIVRVNGSLDTLMAATYLGGKGDENGTRLSIAPDGGIVVAGYTPSVDFRVTSRRVGPVHEGMMDMVVAVLSADLTRLRYGAFLGGADQDRLFGVVAESRDRLLLVGDTRSSEMTTTYGAYDHTHNGSSDLFLAILDPLADSLVYASYLGGIASDIGYVIHRADQNEFLLCGATGSDDFPATVAPHNPLNYTDIFVVHLRIPDTSTSIVPGGMPSLRPTPSMSVKRTGDRLRISLHLPFSTSTSIDLYDIVGRRRKTIAPIRAYQAGTHELWTDMDGATCLIGWRFGGVVVP